MKPVVTKFEASWCSACKEMAGAWARLQHEFGDRVEFRTIDVEWNIDAANRYDVQTLPTVTFENGEDIVVRLTGAARFHELKRAVDRVLPPIAV